MALLDCAHPGVRDEFRWDDDDQPGLVKWDELKNKIRVFLNKNVRVQTACSLASGLTRATGWLAGRPHLPSASDKL